MGGKLGVANCFGSVCHLWYCRTVNVPLTNEDLQLLLMHQLPVTLFVLDRVLFVYNSVRCYSGIIHVVHELQLRIAGEVATSSGGKSTEISSELIGTGTLETEWNCSERTHWPGNNKGQRHSVFSFVRNSMFDTNPVHHSVFDAICWVAENVFSLYKYLELCKDVYKSTEMDWASLVYFMKWSIVYTSLVMGFNSILMRFHKAAECQWWCSRLTDIDKSTVKVNNWM